MLSQFMDVAGIAAWDKKIAWLKQELTDNPHMEEWLREYHGTELRLCELLVEINDSGKYPQTTSDEPLYELLSFAAGFVRIYDNSSDKGKKRLKGMLLDGLKTDKGLASLKHEISTAIHLMIRDFDVEFHDLENDKGGMDFIARGNGIELEIECKVFTGDLGRKIIKRHALTLYNILLPKLEKIYQSASRGILIRITIPDRLTRSPSQHHEIVDSVSSAVLRGSLKTHTEVCDVEVHDFEISESPFSVSRKEDINRSMVADFVSSITGISKLNPNCAILFSPSTRAVIAFLESAKPDNVLSGMDRQLREAAKGQFSSSRPGILAVHVHALNADQLTNLYNLQSTDPQNPTGLRIMTSKLLESPSRNHIHTVCYKANGAIDSDAASGITSGKGVTYSIRNRNNPNYEDQRYQIFSLMTNVSE